MAQPTMKRLCNFPRWIAHRGAGKSGPENTLAAFRLGAQHGYRMFECDAKLSFDKKVFFMHDDSLNRTTNGQGLAGDLTFNELMGLDAGGWHSLIFAGEPVCSLSTAAHFMIRNDYQINVELKPNPGQEYETGVLVSQECRRLWSKQKVWPFLTSFQVAALEGAKASAPELPRGLLVHVWCDEVFEQAVALGCMAMICNFEIWTKERVHRAKQLGLRTASYTVNSEEVARTLLDWGVEHLITDNITQFPPSESFPFSKLEETSE